MNIRGEKRSSHFLNKVFPWNLLTFQRIWFFPLCLLRFRLKIRGLTLLI